GADAVRYEEAPRAGLQGCWAWVDYPIANDVVPLPGAGNPWEQDTGGDGLPDAWVLRYGITDGATAVTKTADDSGCFQSPATPNDDLCITYLDAYQHGLDP